MASHSTSALLLFLLWPSLASSTPLSRSFSSCLSQHASSIAPSDQQINFTTLWSQLDTGQSAPGHLGIRSWPLPFLKFTLLGAVASQGTGYSSQTNFLATLITDSSVLNFQSFSNQSALCSSIRSPGFNPNSNSSAANSFSTATFVPNSGCPYGPGDVALGLSIPLSSTGYPFTTLSTQIQVLDTSTPALTLACIQFDTTPYYPESIYYKLVKWLPFGIAFAYLFVCATGRIWATIISEQLNREAQAASNIVEPLKGPSSDWTARLAPIWWLSWSGQGLLLSGPLLRFSTPSFRDIMSHVQFISLLALFAVQWPEFVYPILAQASWSTLVFNSTLIDLPDSASRPDPFQTPPYDPPRSFVDQFDTPSSPLYLNRSLPNDIVNFGSQAQGIPRWATTIGLSPNQVFRFAISVFAILCGLVLALSAIAYTADLLTRLIKRSRHPNRCSHNPRRDSGAYSSGDTDDDVGYVSPNQRPAVPEPTASSGANVSQAHWWQIIRGLSLKNMSQNEKFMTRYGLGDDASRSSQWPQWRLHLALLQGNLTRLLILFYFPIVIFSSYQLTLLHTSSTLLVVIAAVCLVCCLSLPILQLYRIRQQTTENLIDHLGVALALGPMYNTYADRNELFMGLRFICSFVVGITIGAGQSSAITQAIVLLVAELTETMLTSLWLPWGEGAAMAPLAFVQSVSRIITAVILVVLTPTVSVGAVAAGWLTYIILFILGFVLTIFLGVLLAKLVELVLRLVAHIPFDETRSTRAGGLFGAIRRWDRTGSRSMRHGRAAAIAARRRHRQGSTPTHVRPSAQPVVPTVSRNSLFADNKQSISSVMATPHSMNRKAELGGRAYGSPTGSAGFMGINDDDGNIMSAMSQGPWLRTAGSDSVLGGYTNQLGTYPSPSNTAYSPRIYPPTPTGPDNVPSSGFAVVRGGRASEKTPYQMHDDGKRSWQKPKASGQADASGGREYPPAAHQAQLMSASSPEFSRPLHHQLAPPMGAMGRTRTNLFEHSQGEMASSDFSHPSPQHQQEEIEVRRKRKGTRKTKGNTRAGLLGMLGGRRGRRGGERRDGGSSDEDGWDDSSSSSSSSSSSEEGEESEGEEQDQEEPKTSRLKNLLSAWPLWKTGPADDSRLDADGRGEDRVAGPSEGRTGGATFEVVRQPRPRPQGGASPGSRRAGQGDVQGESERRDGEGGVDDER